MIKIVKIRPWPFKEEVAMLHWLGNAKSINNQWFIQAAFVSNANCIIIELPIGALPLLRVGMFYKDGNPLTTQKLGTTFEVNVKNLGIGGNSLAIDICKKFNMYLYKKAELIKQKVWSFESSGITYHIPHSELIRALFAPNKTIANALLRPHGLDLLVNKSYLGENKIAFIDYCDEIPSSIMNNDFARYFAWIYLDKKIKDSFSSVQSNAYAYAINNLHNFGVPLNLNIPETDETTLVIRGVKEGDEILVYEILGTDIAIPPFDKLHYRHKSIKKYIYTKNPKKKRLTTQEKEQDFILNKKDGERTKVDTNQPVIDFEPTQIAFRNSTLVTRIPKEQQKVNQGDVYISNKGRGGGLKQKEVGVDESIYGGKVTPLEFRSMEIADTYMNYGLENFLMMIHHLTSNNKHLDVHLNFVFLPLGKKFSYLPDGRRRLCAIARVVNSQKVSYVIEVSIPDKRSISTLIFYGNGNVDEDEVGIIDLLSKLINNNGTWSNNDLCNISHKKARHLRGATKEWARRCLKLI